MALHRESSGIDTPDGAGHGVIGGILAYLRDRRLQPGDRLPSERDLAERLGVGRNGVREALATLVALRMVESRPNSGIYLRHVERESSFEALVMLTDMGATPTPTEVAETMEVRAHLEVLAAGLACQRRTEADLARMDTVLHRTEQTLAQGGNIATSDTDFHIALVDATHNSVLVRVLNAFYRFTDRRRQAMFEDMTQGAASLAGLAYWLMRRKSEGKLTLLDPDLFRSPHFRVGISSQMLQQTALGGTMIVLPIFLQMVLEYNALEAGLSIAPLSLSMFAVALLAGKKAGQRSPSRIIRAGFLLLAVGVAVLIPIVPHAHSGWAMAAPLLVAGAGLGLLVSQLNNYTLSPIEDERVSEAAGVNSAGGSFGLSFGLAFAGAIMLASLSLLFTHMANESKVLSPAEQQKVGKALNENAEVLTNTHLEELLAGQPEDVNAEIIHINTKTRPRALQIALLIPLIAALLGLVNGFRMTRLPDPEPSAAAEGILGG